MDESNLNGPRFRAFMSLQEAETFTGAIWRKATDGELEELAELFARDELKCFNQDISDDHLLRIKAEILGEISPLAMVQDLVSMDIQIFYTYFFMISGSDECRTLSFGDGMSKVLKKDGKFEVLPNDYDIFFEM